MKKPKSPSERNLPITGISKTLCSDLKNIAKNLEMTRVAFIRMKLREIRDSYPENMRQPK